MKPEQRRGQRGILQRIGVLSFLALFLAGQIHPIFAQRTVTHRQVGSGCWLYQVKETDPVLMIFVLRVDLKDPFIKLEHVLSQDFRAERMNVTSLCLSYDRPYHRVVGGINADFFSGNLPGGTVLRDGELLKQGRGWSAIGFTKDKAPTIAVFGSEAEADEAEFRDIVGGGPRIIRAGRVSVEIKNEGQREGFDTENHPRTAIGYTRDKRFLVLAVVDGRQPGYSHGISLYELAKILLEFGCHEALNLDGGGSSTMVIRNRVVNSPSDIIGPRSVASALLIISTSPHG